MQTQNNYDRNPNPFQSIQSCGFLPLTPKTRIYVSTRNSYLRTPINFLVKLTKLETLLQKYPLIRILIYSVYPNRRKQGKFPVSHRISVHRPDNYVAVKKIWSTGKLDQNLEKEFLAEVQILGNIRHSNIVKLLCCISNEKSKFLVYEYLEKHSLDQWLHGKKAEGSDPSSGHQNSARGFDVIDTIKTQVEAACNGTVSCADILALATRDGVVLLGGPTWTVPLGRRDSRTASQSAANIQLPGPGSSLSTLISSFSAKGLNAREMVALSGAHTIGQAQCSNFRNRIYNDANIDAAFATRRKMTCPTTGGDTNLASLDIQSLLPFNNDYYGNLLVNRGLLHSDQELFNNGTQDALVWSYASNNALFLSDFTAAMIKMGNISPLTGTNGEIRRNCRRLN